MNDNDLARGIMNDIRQQQRHLINEGKKPQSVHMDERQLKILEKEIATVPDKPRRHSTIYGLRIVVDGTFHITVK